MQIIRKTVLKEAFDWGKTLLLYIGIALLIRFFILNISVVPTGSMIPTIQIRDKIIVLKFSYWFKPIQRGDIVVFKSPYKKGMLMVKRVVGMEGETILIRDGELFINDKHQPEPYIYRPMKEDFGPYTIPENGFFVMGDNRNNSYDCRQWEKKYITRDMIIGKAVYKFGALR